MTTIFYKGQQVSSAPTLMLCIARSRARSPNTHRISQISTTGHAACASCTTDSSIGLSVRPCPAGPHMARVVECFYPQPRPGAQEQQPDLLVLTGLPVSGRMVLAFLFITGWLAILHHHKLECPLLYRLLAVRRICCVLTTLHKWLLCEEQVGWPAAAGNGNLLPNGQQ